MENIMVQDVFLESVQELKLEENVFPRISMSPDYNVNREMSEKGLYLADRTLKVLIRLNHSKVDFNCNIRMDVIKTSEYKNEIEGIALSSFGEDSRFHIDSTNQKKTAELILKQWVQGIESCFVCIYKGKPVGFIETKEDSDKGSVIIHFAAVKEEYRISGAALSMYSYVADYYQKRGYRNMQGRISSKNTAVMNLYSSLGATFSAPWDVYFKR